MDMDTLKIKNDTAADRLIRSNKELEAFIYNASHDLKGPLASSKGLVKLALDSKDPSEIKEYLHLIETSLEKLDNILIALHEVALIRHGQYVLTNINPETVLLNVIKSFKGYPNFNNVKFIIRNEFNNEFTSDEILMQTILRNIIENGIKYARPEASDSYVKILIKKFNCGILLEISDNGIGIPEKYHTKIFDSFFRAAQISSGSGLGLYIVKNAVEKLNGKIEIRKTEAGNGTLFHLFLPCNSDQASLTLF